MFGVFSCVGSFRSRTDVICSKQHAQSEEVGCRPSEPLDSLIGDVLANQPLCVRGGTLCVLCFSMHSVPSFVFMFWSTSMRLAVMYIQDD